MTSFIDVKESTPISAVFYISINVFSSYTGAVFIDFYSSSVTDEMNI